MWLRKIIME